MNHAVESRDIISTRTRALPLSQRDVESSGPTQNSFGLAIKKQMQSAIVLRRYCLWEGHWQ